MASIMKIVDYIGHQTPYFLFISSILLTFKNKLNCFYFVTGFFANNMLNELLKSWIQEPRPSTIKTHTFNLDMSEKHVASDQLGSHQYGMPSGHAQSVFYSTAFVHLVLKNKIVSLVYLLLSLNSVRQRVVYQNHSIGQIAAGSVVGSSFAYLINRFII